MFRSKEPKDIINKKFKKAVSKGYCPTLIERQSESITNLATRLKANSKKETLTNISEWQNNQITFWFERYQMAIFLIVFFFGFMAALELAITLGQWWLVPITGIPFGLSILITVLLLHNYRKMSLKHFSKIFAPNLSLNFVLEKKLAVCRDYAKLSASLLFNIYSGIDVYFVHATAHVATGIFIGKKLYVLDKYLPVATIDAWHSKWNKSRFSKKDVEKINGTAMESVDLTDLLSSEPRTKTDIGKVSNELKRMLGIQQIPDTSKHGILELFRWKKGFILYEDDEIVNYSLATRLRSMINLQMLDTCQIIDLKTIRKDDDLVFRIEYKFGKN